MFIGFVWQKSIFLKTKTIKKKSQGGCLPNTTLNQKHFSKNIGSQTGSKPFNLILTQSG